MKEFHWVLIRGLARETRHWGDFTNLLSQYSSGVTCIELPGVGKKSNEFSPIKIEDYVTKVRQDYLKINHQGKKAICAISLGGMIALAWLKKYPNDFDLAVIINSSASNLSPFCKRVKLNSLKKILGLFFNKNIYLQTKLVLELTTNMISIDKKIIDKWSSFEEEYPTSKSTFLRQLFAASQFQVPLKIGLPLYFIASEKDKLVDPSCSLKLAQFYHSEIEYHSKAGHDLPLDDPDWLIRKLTEFSS